MSALLGIQSGDRYRNMGIPGSHDSETWITIDSPTNTAQLNCTLTLDGRDDIHHMTTIGMADMVAAIEAGIYVAESVLVRNGITVGKQ